MAYFKYQCPNCLRTYDTTVGVSECPQCNKQHDVTKDDMPKSGGRNLVEGQENVDFSNGDGMGAIAFLRIVAWLNLVGGVLACILYLSVFLENVNDNSYEGVSNSLILSIASFFGGVCGCAFLLVVCSIADNLIGIRKNTEIIKEGMLGDKQELLQGNDSGVIDGEVHEEVSDA